MKEKILSIKEEWLHLREIEPKTRIRDAATKLSISEAEIVASFKGENVFQLDTNFQKLVRQMSSIGKVMCLTRNDAAVHERKGFFEEISVNNPHVGLVTGPDIDLRIFFKEWAFAFIVFENENYGFKNSIQIFDHQGNAILKIYPLEEKGIAHLNTINELLALKEDQNSSIHIAAPKEPHQFDDDNVDAVAFQQDWATLKDTHDFFPMLRKYNISRKKALHIAEKFATKVNNDFIVRLLQTISAENWEIMAFVGNHGNIQIHSGKATKIFEIPGWINVMDPEFNLHLKLDLIDETWYVTKPSVDGDIHSIELLDKDGEMILQLFGKRKPGIPERKEWSEGLEKLIK